MARKGMTSVQLKPEIAKMLNHFSKQGVSKSVMINEALRQYLVKKEFQGIREKMVPYARAKKLYTDEDIERALQ